MNTLTNKSLTNCIVSIQKLNDVEQRKKYDNNTHLSCLEQILETKEENLSRTIQQLWWIQESKIMNFSQIQKNQQMLENSDIKQFLFKENGIEDKSEIYSESPLLFSRIEENFKKSKILEHLKMMKNLRQLVAKKIKQEMQKYRGQINELRCNIENLLQTQINEFIMKKDKIIKQKSYLIDYLTLKLMQLEQKNKKILNKSNQITQMHFEEETNQKIINLTEKLKQTEKTCFRLRLNQRQNQKKQEILQNQLKILKERVLFLQNQFSEKQKFMEDNKISIMQLSNLKQNKNDSNQFNNKSLYNYPNLNKRSLQIKRLNNQNNLPLQNQYLSWSNGNEDNKQNFSKSILTLDSDLKQSTYVNISKQTFPQKQLREIKQKIEKLRNGLKSGLNDC